MLRAYGLLEWLCYLEMTAPPSFPTSDIQLLRHSSGRDLLSSEPVCRLLRRQMRDLQDCRLGSLLIWPYKTLPMTRPPPFLEQRWTHRRCCYPGTAEKAGVLYKRLALLPPIQIPTVRMIKVSNWVPTAGLISCSSYHPVPLINRPGVFWSLLAACCRGFFHLNSTNSGVARICFKRAGLCMQEALNVEKNLTCPLAVKGELPIERERKKNQQ